MKTAFVIRAPDCIPLRCVCPKVASSSRGQNASSSRIPKVEEIAHELEELGQEIKPQVLLKKPHGFTEYHESLDAQAP
jgi:hypothetical protein